MYSTTCLWGRKYGIMTHGISPFLARFFFFCKKLSQLFPFLATPCSISWNQWTLLLFHAVSLHLLCEKARIVFYACQPLLLKRDKLCFRSHKLACRAIRVTKMTELRRYLPCLYQAM